MPSHIQIQRLKTFINRKSCEICQRKAFGPKYFSIVNSMEAQVVKQLLFVDIIKKLSLDCSVVGRNLELDVLSGVWALMREKKCVLMLQ